MENPVVDIVDFYLKKQSLQSPHYSEDVHPTTLRLPFELKVKLDVASSFLGTSRNFLIVQVMEMAVEDALRRIVDNPFVSGLTINGLTVDQAIAEGLKGAGLTNIDDLQDRLDAGEFKK
jgi:hypothetical protein